MKRPTYMNICNNPDCLRPRNSAGSGGGGGYGYGLIITPLNRSPVKYFCGKVCAIMFLGNVRSLSRRFDNHVDRMNGVLKTIKQKSTPQLARWPTIKRTIQKKKDKREGDMK